MTFASGQAPFPANESVRDDIQPCNGSIPVEASQFQSGAAGQLVRLAGSQNAFRGPIANVVASRPASTANAVMVGTLSAVASTLHLTERAPPETTVALSNAGFCAGAA